MKKQIFSLCILVSIFSLSDGENNELTSEELYNKALEYQIDKNYLEAEKLYKESMKMKEDPDTAYNLAVLYDTVKNSTQAENYYKKAIQLGQNKAYYKLGYLYSNQKKKELAIENYKKSIELTSNPYAMYNLGVIYSEIDKEMAIKYFKMAVNNGDKLSYYNLAVLYDEVGKDDLAEDNYKLAIDNSNSNLAMYNLGILYENKKNYKKAIEYFERAQANGIEEGIFYKKLHNCCHRHNKQCPYHKENLLMHYLHLKKCDLLLQASGHLPPGKGHF